MDPRSDELYAAPPAEFVQRRDALARTLKAEGHADEAKAIAKLRKPAAAAWALGQVARQHRELLTRFLEADERLRKAQSSGGTAEALRSAMQEQRDRAREVLRAAEQALPAASRAGHTRALQATLLGATAG